MSEPTTKTVAEVIADYLVSQNVTRVYGLCGGHIQPMWDAVAKAGIEIVDTRHEAGAVYMAHAESAVTGNLAVAMVTAGPGLTNAVTAIANASVSGAPVLIISGRTPRPQTGMSAMQDVPQAEVVAPLCVRTEKVSERHHVLPRLDAVVSAALGFDGPTGPAYIDFATDFLDEVAHEADVQARHLTPRRRPTAVPAPEDVTAAADLVRRSRRPLVIGGGAVRRCSKELLSFLDSTGALYLDTGDSRGSVPPDLAAYVPAMRSRAMKEADLVITLGRRMDFQVGYGSPAVFPSAAFLRIGRSFAEVAENRRPEVGVRADVGAMLSALEQASAVPADPDREWLDAMVTGNRDRSGKLVERMRSVLETQDGRMHPYQLISAINEHLTDDAFVVADGGDILSFARVGLRAVPYLDCGALGCLGVGVPFGTAVALNHAGPVISLIGDGSFGFTAIDVDTAVRRGAKVLFVVANNEAWNIERKDQLDRFDGNLVGVDLPGCRYDLVAKGLGAHAERVERVEDLPAAIERGLANAPAVLEAMVTRDAVSPDYLNGLAEVPARQALKAWHDAEMERYH
jgi:acetolactate synthase-1/2/3 large subunit